MNKNGFKELCVLAASTSCALAQTLEVEELGLSSVVGDKADRLSAPSLSYEQRATIAGGSSVVEVQDLVGQVVKPEDLFKLDPGVYARSTGTANDTRLSIRGAGIQRRYGSRGISLLVDGIPANDSDGSYYFRVIDPQSISHIETIRGGNGLRYGSNQLGGAVRIFHKNGVTHPGGELKLELGSFETYRGHLSLGGETGKWDWYFGYSYAESDGYRDRQNWRSHHVTANLGYHWSEDSVTRVYTLFSDSDGFLSGGLTPDQFAQNPKQSRPGQHPDTNRDLSTIRLGQVTQWNTESGNWKFYTNYQYLDFDHITGLGNFTFNNFIDYDTDTFQLGLSGEQEYELGGLQHTLYSDVSASYGRNRVGGFSGFVRPGVTAGINDREDTSRNLKLYLENDTVLADKHHVVLGLGHVWTERKRNLGPNDQRSTGFKESLSGFVGKIGYIYDLDEESQIFANISRSFEAAPFSEAGSVADADAQKALTYELGTRLVYGSIEAEFTTYLAKVKDEFVYEETAPNSGSFAVTNQDTTHLGIESAIKVDLNDLLGRESAVQYDFALSYQLNDFTFDEGSSRGNQIPVVSKHVIVSQLAVSGEKWRSVFTLDWLPSGLYADNANTLETSGYAVADLSFEYKLRENLTVTAGVKNLFDKSYVSTVTVNPSPTSGYISPGDGRAFFTGVKFTW